VRCGAAWRKITPSIAARRQAAIEQAVEDSLREHLVREVRPWVKADVQREIAEHKQGGQRLAAMLHDAAAAEDTRPVAEAALRLALNELLEELEYILGRIDDDDPGYWHANALPKEKWVAHGAMIGATDNRAHEALRAAYREADRISQCLQRQRSQVDFEGLPIGPGRQVELCDPERYRQACANAGAQIARMQRDLAAGR
jgi:hypothetical protein